MASTGSAGTTCNSHKLSLRDRLIAFIGSKSYCRDSVEREVRLNPLPLKPISYSNELFKH